MPKLKEYLNDDLDVFFDADEFAEEHEIDGVMMPIIIDNDLLREQQSKMTDPSGYFVADLLFHVKASYFPRRPEPRSIINFDGKPRRIADVQGDGGVYTITLAVSL